MRMGEGKCWTNDWERIEVRIDRRESGKSHLNSGPVQQIETPHKKRRNINEIGIE
jgi:hypothetical protein